MSKIIDQNGKGKPKSKGERCAKTLDLEDVIAAANNGNTQADSSDGLRDANAPNGNGQIKDGFDLEAEKQRLKEIAGNPELLPDATPQRHQRKPDNVFDNLENKLKQQSDEQALSNFDDFDDNFFVIRNYFGSCRVGYRKVSKNKRTNRIGVELVTRELGDFYKAYIDKLDSDKKPIAPTWFKKTTQRYNEVVYKDPATTNSDELNLYHGFSVDPKPGDITLYREFVQEIACSGDKELAQYWYDLGAYGVQNPFDFWGVYVICYSKSEGTGKDTFVDFYGDLFMDYFTTNNPSRIVGRFNDQIAFRPVVKLSESSIPVADIPKLRGIITSSKLDIEGKGLKGGNADNIMKFFMTTNIEDSVRVSLTDRRTLALEFATKRIGDKEYFNRLYKWYYQEGGINHVLHFFKEREIGDFKPYPRPITKLLRRMQDKSLRDEEKALLEMLDDGYFPVIRKMILHPNGKNRQEIKVRRIGTGEFREKFRDRYPRILDISDNLLCDLFKEIGCTRKAISTGSIWVFPTLEEARANWDKKQNRKRDWDASIIDWEDEDDRTAKAKKKHNAAGGDENDHDQLSDDKPSF